MRRWLLLLLVASIPKPSAFAQLGVRHSAFQVDALPPAVPAAAPSPEFPLRVQVFQVRWGGLTYRNHGYGTANLLDGTTTQGFDFGFECDRAFVENRGPDETYQARWKKQPYALEILTADLDGKHQQPCKLQIALERHPFDPGNQVRFIHGVSSSLRVRWSDPDFAYEVRAPDYPVQFHVVDTQRREGPNDDVGWGTANLFDPATNAPRQGASFQYECNYGFMPNSQLQTYYQGHWVEPGSKLEILMQRPGSDKVDKCVLQVSLQPQPYPERAMAVPASPASPAGAPAFSQRSQVNP
jgi:hypothetical protein